MNSRARSGSSVTQHGMLQTIDGAGRPAPAAASLMRGAMWDSIVRGPTHHRMVPSVRVPAMRSIWSPSAASITFGRLVGGSGHGAVGGEAPDLAPVLHRLAVAAPAAAPRGSRACGGSASPTSCASAARRPARGDRPMPSTRRPWVFACAVSALAASAIGCWSQVGTTAVPSSITLVAGPGRAEHAEGVGHAGLGEPVRGEALGLGRDDVGGDGAEVGPGEERRAVDADAHARTLRPGSGRVR